MNERINLILRRESCPELYDYFLTRKNARTSYLDILEDLIAKVEKLEKENVAQKDWTGMRLALRGTEKNSHIILEVLNNMLLARPIQPVSSHEQKSPNLAYFEQDWKDYLQGLQAGHYTHQKKTLQDFAEQPRKSGGSQLPMPPFDFGEEFNDRKY